MRDYGQLISSNGVADTGGDAIGTAIHLLRRLQEEPRSSLGSPVLSTPVRARVEAAVAPSSPVRFYVPRLVEAEPHRLAPIALAEMRALYLTDADSAVPWSRGLLRVVPGAQTNQPLIRNADGADLPLTTALEGIDPGTEAIVLAIDASRYSTDALLTDELYPLSSLLNALFAVVQHLHAGVSLRNVRVGTLVYNAWEEGVLNPLTGLFAGFIKSLRRDFPQAFVVATVSDLDVGASLPMFEAELAQEQRDGVLPEIFFRRGARLREVLRPNDVPCGELDRPLFSADTVVLATGGARGVTAILIEDMLARYGCRVIALGRTGTDGFPGEALAMSAEELRAYEPEYYRRVVAGGQRKSPAEMKKQFEALVSANEVHHTIQRLKSAGGSFEYIRADITDAQALDGAIADIYERYGKIDVVIHGAGTQISKRIAKKTLNEFDLVVSSKLTGLRCLHGAVARHAGTEPVDYHVLTSAFSFWGNDGQPDYGAANETLNRLAAAKTAVNGLRGHWSTLAWLAWPTVGMAKEFSWLGSQRTLHPLGKEEGQQIFRALTERVPAQAPNILATANEIAYFKVPVTGPSVEREWLREPLDLSPGAAPYLEDHVVDGIQTVPGAVEFYTAAVTALRLCPGMHVEALHHARFKSFLRVYPDRPSNAKVFARILHADVTGATVRVQICSDFVHASGRVIRENVEHYRADVTCTRSAPVVDGAAFAQRPPSGGCRIDDPYVSKLPALQLKGMFDCLRGIALDDTHQFAELALSERLRTSPLQAMLVPVLALDAMARVGTMLESGDAVAICVPVAATSLAFYFDLSSDSLFDLFNGARFTGTRPRPSSDTGAMLHMDRMWAVTKDGRPLMEIRRSVAKVQGFVPLQTLTTTKS
ncbi:MAG TPA: SDR family NAD(P)-dependent oxidoreductase [Candidatus Acidoferrales bacterium]|nr:SDR family NAD(P)-dependent oxidoreductase [Candidatus Acidoferrales bacterium]